MSARAKRALFGGWFAAMVVGLLVLRAAGCGGTGEGPGVASVEKPLESGTASHADEKGVPPAEWAAQVAAYIERDRRQAFRHEREDTWVLNQPGMRIFVRANGLAVVGEGIEVEDADSATSTNAPGTRWGFGYRFTGVTFAGSADVAAAPRSRDGVANQVVVSHESGILEQYENLPEGVEQRFVIPTGTPGDFVIHGRWLGRNVSARIAGSELVFSAGGEDRVAVSAPLAYDAEGNGLPARFVLGERTIDIVVEGARSFPVLVDPVWTAIGESHLSENFGFSIAYAGDINGDGRGDIVVGAPSFGTSYTYAGRALVFLGAAGGLQATPVWESSGPDQAGASFGQAVTGNLDTDGDGYKEIMVGAPGYDFYPYSDAGRVEIYESNGENIKGNPLWVQNGPAGKYMIAAKFGFSVARAGKVNNDIYDDIIIGAPGYDLTGKTDAGAAFVYYGSAAGPGSSPFITSGPTAYQQAGAQVGFSVAGGINLNAPNTESYSDVVIGAPYSDSSGRVYVYFGSATGLSASNYWSATGSQVAEGFGYSVAVAKKINGDEFGDVLVGSPGRTVGGYTNAGSVTGFTATGSSMNNTPFWTCNENGMAQQNAKFGQAVSAGGDVDLDGFDDIIVGAPYQDSSAGKVFMYRGGASMASPCGSAVWSSSGDAQANARYGMAVAIVPDVNGEEGGGQFADVLVGAPYFQVSGVNVGKAYLCLGADAASLICEPNGTSCNDRDACTEPDTCTSGICGGPPRNCNDSNVCTDDGCNSQTGCTHTNNTAQCAAATCVGLIHYDARYCSNGTCGSGPQQNCDDGNVCTTDTCDPVLGCQHTNNTAPCNDGNACTTNDTCSNGVCVGGPPPETDVDCDGVLNASDNCPETPNPDQADADSDGVGDVCDNCPERHNPGQEDTLGGPLGDACDDSDGDGLSDWVEVHQTLTSATEADSDQDGLDDGQEVNQYGTDPNLADSDGDGMSDLFEISQNQNPLDGKPLIRDWLVELPPFRVHREHYPQFGHCNHVMSPATVTFGPTRFVLHINEAGQAMEQGTDGMTLTEVTSFESECHECMYDSYNTTTCYVGMTGYTQIRSPAYVFVVGSGGSGIPAGEINAAGTHLDIFQAFAPLSSPVVTFYLVVGGYWPVQIPSGLGELFNVGRFSNKELGTYTYSQYPLPTNYSYRIPLYHFIKGEPFELGAGIDDACAGDTYSVTEGVDCRMIVASANGEPIRFWPMYVRFEPDEVYPYPSPDSDPGNQAGNQLSDVTIYGPPGYSFVLTMSGRPNTGQHIDSLHRAAGNCNGPRPTGFFPSTSNATIAGNLPCVTPSTYETTYHSGQFSGDETPELQVQIAPGYNHIVVPDYTGDQPQNTWLRIRVPGLVQLPPGDHYEIHYSEDLGHCGSNYHGGPGVGYNRGTNVLQQRIQQLADLWYNDPVNTQHLPLRVNDMSLIWGGRFDILADWQGHHIEHRFGSNADIKTRDYSQAMVSRLFFLLQNLQGCGDSLNEHDTANHLHMRCY